MIREYRTADYAAVRACMVELQEVERALDPRLPPGDAVMDAYLEGLFRRCAEQAGRLFVAEVDGQVVGFVSVLGDCRCDDPEEDPTPYAFVDDLAVLSDHRGRGYGSALLRHAEEYAARCGRAALRLRVKPRNNPARALYEREGYREYLVELEKHLPTTSPRETVDAPLRQ